MKFLKLLYASSKEISLNLQSFNLACCLFFCPTILSMEHLKYLAIFNIVERSGFSKDAFIILLTVVLEIPLFFLKSFLFV